MKGQIKLTRKDFQLDCILDLKNEVTGVFGSSGCGKTTLLRCIAGLEKNAIGHLNVTNRIWQDDDKKICLPAHKRPISYVFQDARLFTHLNTKDNLLFAKNKSSLILFDEIIEQFNLTHLLFKMPAHLSGGEQQRIAIARSLMSKPDLLLMDEPLSALDEKHKQKIIPFIEKIHKQFNIPVLYVSHSLGEISLISDSLLLMKNGKITAQDKTERILTDLNYPFAELSNANSIVTGVVHSFDEKYHLVKIKSSIGDLLVPNKNIKIGKRLKLRILAKDVSLIMEKPYNTSIINILPATINAIDKRNSYHVNVQLKLNGHTILSRISHLSLDKLKLKPNKNIYIQIKGIAIKELG